jgi:putative SOS response-associated peptidase YedK
MDHVTPQPAVFPNYAAPIVRNAEDGRELALARWGMPSPEFALQGRRVDHGVVNVRNPASSYWKRWLGPAHRCVVPFTSFAANEKSVLGYKSTVWFALDRTRPLAFFAGIWTSQWTAVRRIKEGQTTSDAFAFLTTDPNKELEAVHPSAMPVILRTEIDVNRWLEASEEEALALQRPLPNGSLEIVARGLRKDGEQEGSPSEARLAWRRNPVRSADR